MVQEHYFNPREFYGEWVIPAIARNVPGYQDQDYWRGRIWGPMNFLVYLGMRNYDLGPARTDLAERSRKLLMKSWQSDRAVYENYNCDHRSGQRRSQQRRLLSLGRAAGRHRPDGARALSSKQTPDRFSVPAWTDFAEPTEPANWPWLDTTSG